MNGSDRGSSAFTWPPRALPASAPVAEPATLQSIPGPARTTWLRRIEQAWLDPISGPLAHREAASGWAPDPFDAYCDQCGRDVGLHEVTEFGCARCRDRRLRWRRYVRLGRYESPLSDWICEVKFSRAVRLGIQLGERLGARLDEALRQAGKASPGGVGGLGGAPALVPVPTHPWRRLARGLDHTAVLAQGAAAVLGGEVVSALRARRRPSQRTLSPTRRRENLVGSMWARESASPQLAGRVVILIDDVSTTGATLHEAARALLAAFSRPSAGIVPPEVWLATLAVTPDRAEALSSAV